MNVEDFEAAVRREGYAEVLKKEYPSGYRADDHTHPFDARALIVAGDIAISVDGVDRHYPVGTVFELAAGTVHKERAGAEGVTYLVGRRMVTVPG
jgi:quercetin dioxygenase-like cupin family protein